jgi:uncharacterized membrane protein YjgN (DUF898 family)/Flp pilus assembly protein TadD
MASGNCKYTGNGGVLFSTVIIHLFILSTVTLGLYAPWAWVRIFRVKASHTTIQGKQVQFVGTGAQLLVLAIVQGLLTVLTLGFYGPWAICKFFEWKAANTLVGDTPSRFVGTGGGLFFIYLVHLLILPILTLGIYYVYGIYRLYAWKEEHTRYAGEKTSFGGGFMEFLKVSIIGGILNFMTMNLFTPWSLSMLFNWQIKGLAVGDDERVAHFPPVKTNFAAAAAMVVIGLLPIALLGFIAKTQFDKYLAAAQMAKTVKIAPPPGAKAGGAIRPSVTSPSHAAETPPPKVQVVKKIEPPPSKAKAEGQAPERPTAKPSGESDTIFNRAWFVGSQGNLREAENLYTQAIAIDSKDAEAYYNRGLIRLQTRQYDLSVKDFTTALELDPKFYEAYCNRGNAHYRAGRSDLAISDYGMAMQLKPDDGDLFFNRGMVLLNMGREDEAKTDLKEAARMGQENAAAVLKSRSL